MKDLMMLEVAGSEQRGIMLVSGPSPYLWIGPTEGECFGVVADKDVKRLKQWCERILEKQAKMKGK